jgi:hypothetical protein
MDNRAQMLVYEAIVCAALLALAVFFVYQMHPPMMQSTIYSNQLKILGDDALRSLGAYPSKNYSGYSLLEEYIIDNNTANFTKFLNSTFPATVGYSIYISNGTVEQIWYNGSVGGIFGLVTRSHYIIAIDPDLSQPIPNYTGSVYDVILEMWQI